MENRSGCITEYGTGRRFHLPLSPSARYPQALGQGGFEAFDACDGFVLCCSDARLSSRVRLESHAPPPLAGNPVLTFFCAFAGCLGVRPQGFNRPLPLQRGELAVFQVAGPQAIFDLPPTHHRTFSGGFSIDFLRTVTVGMALPPTLQRMLENGETAPLVEHGWLDRRHSLILNDLLHCPWTGAAAQLYQQAKGLELLACLSQALAERKSEPRERWRRADVDRLYAAREFLLANLEAPPTLIALARYAGLCATKLKRGFREIFNTTVTDTLRDARLQSARRLLAKTDLPLKAIAEQVGYSDAASLSHAFRSHFGIAPGQVRERRG